MLQCFPLRNKNEIIFDSFSVRSYKNHFPWENMNTKNTIMYESDNASSTLQILIMYEIKYEQLARNIRSKHTQAYFPRFYIEFFQHFFWVAPPQVLTKLVLTVLTNRQTKNTTQYVFIFKQNCISCHYFLYINLFTSCLISQVKCLFTILRFSIALFIIPSTYQVNWFFLVEQVLPHIPFLCVRCHNNLMTTSHVIKTRNVTFKVYVLDSWVMLRSIMMYFSARYHLRVCNR